MLNYWSLNAVSLDKSWVTIGSFDGVHLGHQAIIHQLTAGASQAGAPSVVVTFYPHPGTVLGRRNGPLYLTSPEHRAALLGRMGVDIVINLPFNRSIANLTAYDFMAWLKRALGIQTLWVGYDFALGRGREGTVERLSEIGAELGYTLRQAEPLLMDGEPVSSSRIRAALSQGDLVNANRLLGRPYRLEGEVVPGDGRGRTIGVPTANLDVWAQRVIPRAGVYICRVKGLGGVKQAVANVGVRPTFEDQPVPPRVEAHLLDYRGNLYGRQLKLDFMARLRDEQRFPNIETLVAQIQNDIAQTRAWFDQRA